MSAGKEIGSMPPRDEAETGSKAAPQAESARGKRRPPTLEGTAEEILSAPDATGTATAPKMAEATEAAARTQKAAEPVEPFVRPIAETTSSVPSHGKPPRADEKPGAKPASAAIPPSPKALPPEKKRGLLPIAVAACFGGIVGGGSVLAGLPYVMPYFLPRNPEVPALTSRLATLEQQAKAPPANPLAERLAGAEQKLAKLEPVIESARAQGETARTRAEILAAEVKRLDEALKEIPKGAPKPVVLPEGQTVDLAPLEARLATLDGKIAATEAGLAPLEQKLGNAAAGASDASKTAAKAGELATDAGKTAAKAGELATEAGRTATEASKTAGSTAATVAQLAERLAGAEFRTEARLKDMQGLQAQATAAPILASLGGIRGALERGEGFATELAALEALGVASEKLVPLKAIAAAPPPPPRQLAGQFAALVPQITAPPALPKDASLTDKLWANASGLVKVRAAGEAPGDDPAAVSARVQAAFGRGDLAAATTEISKLSAEGQALAKAVSAAAQARLAAAAAIKTIEQDTFTALAAQKRAP